MNAEDLRALQAPIKARYKAQPEAARRVFRASGTLLKLTERYCVILQTLRTPPRLTASVQRIGRE